MKLYHKILSLFLIINTALLLLEFYKIITINIESSYFVLSFFILSLANIVIYSIEIFKYFKIRNKNKSNVRKTDNREQE